MGVLKSIAMAFSLYSRIPMPSIRFRDEDMKYCMCAFPLVGVVQSVIAVMVYKLLVSFGCGIVMTAGILTALPIVFTGGIHMDGLLDTYDALCSYGDKDKKLAILKDPHVGGFAVIHAIVHVLLTFACWNELIEKVTEKGADERIINVCFAGYVLSRILSAISVAGFRKAKSDGMVSDISKAQDRKSIAILIVMLAILLVPAVILFSEYTAMLLIAAPVFVYYRYRSYKEFGGVTGDLAGWFLQNCELVILICAASISVLVTY